MFAESSYFVMFLLFQICNEAFASAIAAGANSLTVPLSICKNRSVAGLGSRNSSTFAYSSIVKANVAVTEFDTERHKFARNFTILCSDKVDTGSSSTFHKVPSPAHQVVDADAEESPWMNCDVCFNTGFVSCRACDATGVIQRSNAPNVFFCPECVGHKKLRCPTCGGKCYMCE